MLLAVLTISVTPSQARSIDARSSMSPTNGSAPSFASSSSFFPSRDRARTLRPSWRRRRTMTRPSVPVDPATRISSRARWTSVSRIAIHGCLSLESCFFLLDVPLGFAQQRLRVEEDAVANGPCDASVLPLLGTRHDAVEAVPATVHHLEVVDRVPVHDREVGAAPDANAALFLHAQCLRGVGGGDLDHVDGMNPGFLQKFQL